MESRRSLGAGEASFDSEGPFRGVVLCCTAIPPDQRAKIDTICKELGGQHKFDLTADVTHLLVGEYDTAKYHHVAQERPDIRCMSAGWVEAVRDVWRQDADMDWTELEKTWTLKTFEAGGGEMKADGTEGDRPRLVCCLSGFNDYDERQGYIDVIKLHGGAYSGALSREVTHLIVQKAEGKKYLWAKQWQTPIVAIEWVLGCIKRGMILQERYFDPSLPASEMGKGAVIRTEVRKRDSLGKRNRGDDSFSTDDGKRKLRKTASMRANSQRESLWGEILGRDADAGAGAGAGAGVGAGAGPAPPDASTAAKAGRTAAGRAVEGASRRDMTALENNDPACSAPFSAVYFYAHGFSAPQRRLISDTLLDLGAAPCGTDLAAFFSAASADYTAATAVGAKPPSPMLLLMCVPQRARPDEAFQSRIDALKQSYPRQAIQVETVTEFYVERCLHQRTVGGDVNNKVSVTNPSALLHPHPPASSSSPGARASVVGRPFPVWPIPGFDSMAISTAGFGGVALHQVDQAVRQIGARYEEVFRQSCDVLVVADQNGRDGNGSGPPAPSAASQGQGQSRASEWLAKLTDPALKAVRRQKLQNAVDFGVPVVREAWLWTCVQSGRLVDVERFLFDELRQGGRVGLDLEKGGRKGKDKKGGGKSPAVDKGKEKAVSGRETGVDGMRQMAAEMRKTTEKGRVQRPRREPSLSADDFSSKSKTTTAPTAKRLDIDMSTTIEAAPRTKSTANDAESTGRRTKTNPTAPSLTQFDTALTHQAPPTETSESTPLSELSSNALNQSPAPQQKATAKLESGETVPDSTETSPPLESTEEQAVGAPVSAPEGAPGQPKSDVKPSPKTMTRLREEAEHKALASRLTELLEDHTAAVVAAASEENNNTSTGGGVHSALGRPAVAPPRKRQREILGRATSNVSVASSGSGMDATASINTAAATSLSIPDHQPDDSDALYFDGHDGSRQQQQPAPPATQIQYVDEDAQAYKRSLMKRAMSGAGASASGGDGSSKGRTRVDDGSYGSYGEGSRGTGSITLGELESARKLQELVDAQNAARANKGKGRAGGSGTPATSTVSEFGGIRRSRRRAQ